MKQRGNFIGDFFPEKLGKIEYIRLLGTSE